MKLIWKITKAELQTLFFSPLAWLMLVVLGIWVFNVFYDKFDLLVRTQELGDSIPICQSVQYGCCQYQQQIACSSIDSFHDSMVWF